MYDLTSRRSIAATADVARLKPMTLASVGDGAAAVADISEVYLDHLKCINATFYDQLKVVDQKAAYVFTFLIAMMIWSVEVRGHFARVLEPVASPDWLLSVVLASSLTAAAVSAILVVVPRNRCGGASLYWGAWPKAGDLIAAARCTGDRAVIADDYCANIQNLAAICRQKYRLVRCSYIGLLAAMASYILAVAAA